MGNKQLTTKKQNLSPEEAWGVLDLLPSELVLHILSFADCSALGKAERVNSCWRDLIRQQDGLWKPQLVALTRHDPLARWETPRDELWRELEATGKGYKTLTKELILLQKSTGTDLQDQWQRFLPDYLPGARALVSKIKVGKLLIEGKRSLKALMVGLDAAGKTTMLYHLSPDRNVDATVPTIGFNVETFAHSKLSFVSWDVGGPDKIRPLYRHYFGDIDVLIWVVDLNDRDRIDEATNELQWFLRELPEVPLLVYGNKIDLPHALSVDELIKRMGLEQMQGRKWHVQPSCAITRVGIYEGLGWLATHGA